MTHENKPLVAKALKIASKAHDGQKYGDNEYMYHPIMVANYCRDLFGDDDELIATALLHDVIEDSDITEIDLLKMGIPQSVVDDVVALTRRTESYMQYITDVSRAKSVNVRKVKFCDLMMNFTNNPTEKQSKRYGPALILMMESLNRKNS